MAALPGILAFAPHMDTFYPLLTLLALSLADLAVRRNDWRYGLLSGLSISLATYFSLVNGLIAPLVGFYVIAQLAQEQHRFLAQVDPAWAGDHGRGARRLAGLLAG
jgi:hypothetical protein